MREHFEYSLIDINILMDCIDKDINVDERVFKMLAERIDKLRMVAVEESYEHSV